MNEARRRRGGGFDVKPSVFAVREERRRRETDYRMEEMSSTRSSVFL